MSVLLEPEDMVRGIRSDQWHYAFVSFKHLFSNIINLTMLKENGFHVSIYESDEHIVMPDGQVAFKFHQSELIETYPIHLFPFELYL